MLFRSRTGVCLRGPLPGCLPAHAGCFKFFENPVVSSAVESRKNNPEAVIPDSRLKSRPAPVKEAAALYRLHELMFPDRKLPAKYDGFAVSYKHPAAVAPAKAPDQAPAQPQKKQ